MASGDHAGATSGPSSDPSVHLIGFALALVAIGCCWPLVRMQIPPASKFEFADLLTEHWAHRHALQPWLDQRWAWLAAHDYHLWFAAAAFPGVLAIAVVQSFERRSAKPLFYAPLGSLAGSISGYVIYLGLRADSWPMAVMMPATFGFLGGAVAARLAVRAPRIRHLRGTRLRGFSQWPYSRLAARIRARVSLAGVPLSHEDETMHVAAIGATGSGKSTALQALMADALRRGDRHVVADPEGAAMSAFFVPGDIILNPFDRRCARWDLLAEIERPSDYAFLAQSLLPHLGQGDQDQWITYAQRLLADTMETFVTFRLGSSDDYIAMLASAKISELRELCTDTPSARYFEEGGERMLASILGTLAPAIGHLRLILALAGEPFSIRRWIRQESGSLWIPYAANQVAALRGLASCWMNIAIFETLSLAPSRERRIWFHVDELDALGRIEGLKDAQARLRKFGGRVAIGFQSYAQVKQIYGDGAQTIIENCGNLLILRSGGSGNSGTAKLASDLIGKREIERDDLSVSRTHGRQSSRSQSTQSRRAVEDAVLASEIMQRRNLEGLVKRASRPEWVRTNISFREYPKRISPFEPI